MLPLQLTLDHTLRTVALGAAMLGLVSGALGSFAVLRRQSMLGDAISHAALPGIALAFLLTGSKSTPVLLLGAAVAGWLASLAVMHVTGASRVKEDAALGIMLSVFFGFGLVLLTYVQKRPDASQAGLDRFLFGQAATLLERDVWLIAGLGAATLLGAAAFWKEFKLLAFDRDYGESLGLPMGRMDVVLTTLLVASIVVGLQTVGVVLMSAMVVAPAAAARQWTDRLGLMVMLAGGFGAAAGVAGALLSSSTAQLPTGPTIVLCLTALTLASLLLAPNRGVVWARVRQARAHRRLHTDAVLHAMAEMGRHHADHEHAHGAAAVEAAHPGARHELAALEARGLVRRRAGGWALTPAGWTEAARRGPVRHDPVAGHDDEPESGEETP